MTRYLLIADADTGHRLAAAKDAITADEKAQACEQRGHRIVISQGPRIRPLPARASTDVPYGYRVLPPRQLAPSTLKREAERWRAEALTFPAEWGRWGQGHLTANVAYACKDRGLVEIAVPIKGSKPYLYRQRRAYRGTS